MVNYIMKVKRNRGGVSDLINTVVLVIPDS